MVGGDIGCPHDYVEVEFLLNRNPSKLSIDTQSWPFVQSATFHIVKLRLVPVSERGHSHSQRAPGGIGRLSPLGKSIEAMAPFQSNGSRSYYTSSDKHGSK